MTRAQTQAPSAGNGQSAAFPRSPAQILLQPGRSAADFGAVQLRSGHVHGRGEPGQLGLERMPKRFGSAESAHSMFLQEA